MNQLNTLFALMGKIAFLMGLGFFLRRKQMISKETQIQLSALLLKVILPANILVASQQLFSPKLAGELGTMGVIALAYYLVLPLVMELIKPVLPFSAERKKMFILMGIFPNAAFVGFPLIQGLFGESALLYGVIYSMVFQVAIFTYGAKTLADKKSGGLLNLLLEPANVASLASLLLFFSPMRFPLLVKDSLALVGNMMVPLSMIIMGCMIADTDLKKVFTRGASYLVCFVRLILVPTLVLVVLRLFRVENPVASIAVIMSGLPIATILAILAGHHGVDAEFTAQTVLLSMILMMITIPLMLTLTLAVFQ